MPPEGRNAFRPPDESYFRAGQGPFDLSKGRDSRPTERQLEIFGKHVRQTYAAVDGGIVEAVSLSAPSRLAASLACRPSAAADLVRSLYE